MGGEFIWFVVFGFLLFGDGMMVEWCDVFVCEYDCYCIVCIFELCGSDVLVGVLLCDLVVFDVVVGVIFFNNSGYFGMCGYGMIGVVCMLYYMGCIVLGVYRIEMLVGIVEVMLYDDLLVSVCNVFVYCYV